jgi:hypothetical protein
MPSVRTAVTRAIATSDITSRSRVVVSRIRRHLHDLTLLHLSSPRRRGDIRAIHSRNRASPRATVSKYTNVFVLPYRSQLKMIRRFGKRNKMLKHICFFSQTLYHFVSVPSETRICETPPPSPSLPHIFVPGIDVLKNFLQCTASTFFFWRVPATISRGNGSVW